MQKILNTGRVVHHTLVGLILSNRKASLLVGLMLLLSGFANRAKASNFTDDYVILNSTRYYTIKTTQTGSEPPFLGIGNIGTFDRGTGRLALGAEANTSNTGNQDVSSVQLSYRVYLQTAAPGTITPLTLANPTGATGPGGKLRKWVNTTSNPNLLDATSGPGHYVLEVFFQGTTTGNGAGTIFDNRNGANYTATFDVTGSVPVQWTGSVNSDWFTDANWSGGVRPGPTTDATIPFTSSGGRYPTITSGLAQVRTLTINGTSINTQGARNFLRGGELQVFGNLVDPNGGLFQTGGIFTLAGSTQTFDGGTFFDVRIQGGGTKILNTQLTIITSLTFVGAGGIISTLTDNSDDHHVDLVANSSIIGESETSYVLGFLRANRFVNQGATNTFGNIGVDLTAMNGAPGNTLATRLTGYVYNGVPPSKSVKRSFSFGPDNPDNLNFSLVFHYLDTEINGIPESNLVLFRSLSGGIPFGNLGKSSADPLANTLTRNNIPGTLAATFTLGDAAVPLPVTVSSFTAVAQGPDALLRWTTAQEANSKGFEVQVSLDGQAFRALGFVASETPNSSAQRSYQYRDVAAGAQGATRYYRLRQLDLDGKESFFGPQAVAFGALAAVAAQGYPNPFTSEINLILQPAAAGLATVSVIDGLGRQVRTWQPTLELGASNLRLDELQALPHGLYVVQVRYSTGQTERLKLMK